MSKELVTVTFDDGSSLELGTFDSDNWDATVGESGSIVIETPEGVTCYARGHWTGFHSVIVG